MNLLSKREIANIQLFSVEISESELRIYRQLFLDALENLDAQEIEQHFGAYPDELEGMLDDIENIMEEAGLLTEEEPEAAELVTEAKE
jgi:ribosome assembly protein YihI (activator of Der GTPase)